VNDIILTIVLFFYPISAAITDAHGLLGQPSMAWFSWPWCIGGFVSGAIARLTLALWRRL
jgi:hypothetical protein